MAIQNRTVSIPSSQKTCQNCQTEFVIEPEDFAFYQKMKVPPPTFCPDCGSVLLQTADVVLGSLAFAKRVGKKDQYKQDVSEQVLELIKQKSEERL